MNGLRYFIFSISFLMVSGVFGQGKLEKIIIENEVLIRDIEETKKEIENIRKKTLIAETAIKRDSLSCVSMVRERDSLLWLNTKEYLAQLKQEIDSLEKCCRATEDSVNSIVLRRDEVHKAIVDNNSYMDRMDAFRKVQTQQQFEEKLNYTNKAFSELQLTVLDSLVNHVSEFRSMEAFDEYVKRLQWVVANKKLYDRGVVAINSAFNGDTIFFIREAIIPLLDLKQDDLKQGVFKLSEPQFCEIDTLDIKLSRFKNGTRLLQNTIAEINNNKSIKKLRADNNRSGKIKIDLQELIKPYIMPKKGTERSKQQEHYFRMIPYLERTLEQYWEEVKENPFEVPTKTECEIQNIVVEE